MKSLHILFLRLLSVGFALILANSIFASKINLVNDCAQLNDEQFEVLIEIKKSFTEIDQQIENKSLSNNQAKGARIFVLNHYRAQMAQPLPIEKLRTLALSCMQDERCREKTIMDTFSGVFNFVNIMWFIASLLILFGIITVLMAYKKIVLRVLAIIKRLIYKLWQPVGKLLYAIFSLVLPTAAKLLKSIPVLFYEFLSVFVTLMIIYLAQFSSAASQAYIVFIGNVLFMLASSLLFYRNRNAIGEFYKRYVRYLPIRPITLLMSIIVLNWTLCTVIYQSQLLGVFTIALLLIWRGFGIVPTSLFYSFRHNGRKNLVRGTLGALLLLTIYIIVSIFELNIPYYHNFESGLKYLGSYVFYIGLLIVSNKWVCRRYHFNFWFFQAISIVAGFSALYLGSVYDLSILRGLGGIFLALYMILKPLDFHWRKKRMAWMLLIFGVLLFAVAQVISSYPEFFFMTEI